MRVSVTMDDIGLSPAVNAAAERLLASETLDCLSILATSPWLEDAAVIAGNSRSAVSVHLNCIEPPFLTGSEFPSSYETWFFKGRSLASKVKDEWRMQIEKVLSLGIMVTRLDSHRHLHHCAGLRSVILELAGEYGISHVRAAVLPDRLNSPEAFVLDRLGRKLVRKASGMGISTPSLMLGFSCSGCVSREYLQKMEPKLKGEGTAELVVHPALEADWSLCQPAELRLLESDWFAAWLRRN